jgi:hypothetical protein
MYLGGYLLRCGGGVPQRLVAWPMMWKETGVRASGNRKRSSLVMLKPACSMAAGHTAAVIAASGGSGRLWYPAASPYVTAVGGTSVAQDPVTGGF